MQTVRLWLLLLVLGAGPHSVGSPLPSSSPERIEVIVFLSTECPISQQYTRQLIELYRDFSGRNVSFTAYFPLPTDTGQVLADFRRTYRLPFSLRPDPGQRMARLLHAGITPEVVVRRKGAIAYQGAIDNWFVRLGKRRPRPTRYYLRDALTALLASEPVVPARTEAIGCYIE